MNILIVSQYFWPENFRINDLAIELKNRNHNITVLTGKPSYPNREKFKKVLNSNFYNDIDIIRIPHTKRGTNNFSLFINYLSFFISGLVIGIFKLKHKKFDVIFVFQPSPIFPVLLGVIIGRLKKCKVSAWILDLWPETLFSFGFLKSKISKKISFLISDFTYRNIDLLFTQSESMKNHLKKRLPKNNVKLLPNWVEKDFEKFIIPEIRKKVKTIFFTGNIGKAQDLEKIIECFKILNNEDISLKIIGDGKNKSYIQDLVIKNKLNHKIFFKNSIPLNSLSTAVKDADAMLLSLKNNKIFEITIPGKLQTYLAIGLPILGMINGEGAKLIKNNEIGYSSKAGYHIGLSKNIIKLMNSSMQLRKKMSHNAQNLAKKKFSRIEIISYLEIQLKKLTELCV